MRSDSEGTSDPFSKFWLDMMGQMANAAMPKTSASPQEEAMKKMRQAFFDAWERHCVEVMGSDAFLDMMKQSMDNALAFRQHMNTFLEKAVSESQIPTRGDTDAIVQVLRSLEERVLDRLEDLSRRVDRLEARAGNRSPKGAAPRKRSSKGSRK